MSSRVNKPTSAAELAEFEALASISSTGRGQQARWERKKAQALAEQSGASSDRLIPNRGSMDLANVQFALSSGSDENQDSEYRRALEAGLLKQQDCGVSGSGSSDSDHRILSFKGKAPAPREDYQNAMSVIYTSNKVQNKVTAKASRHIPDQPLRILDAPDLLDDYYLNLVSWSSRDVVAVALGPAVYLWDHASGSIDELCNLEESSDHVCSVEWVPGGTHLAVGTASGSTQLWDASQGKLSRKMDGHSDRVGSLAWNDAILSSGSRDTSIVHHDVRVQSHLVARLQGHDQEVCGLKWAPGGHSLASGGNDNRLCIWDASLESSRRPRFSLNEHQAAVKALAWCPHERNLIASGGGTADRCIKFWNSQTGALLNSIDTGSQVCALLWSPHEKELLSSHGFSKNELCLWRYPSMTKVKELTGHTARVLHMAMSPSGASVVSAGADESLRFWNVFGEPSAPKKAAAGPSIASSMRISSPSSPRKGEDLSSIFVRH